MKTTLLIMAAGIGSRFGTGIKQLEPVDDANHIIMDYSIHDAIEAGFNHVVWRTKVDNRVHRERNHDDAILSSSDVVIRRNDREQMEENPVAKRKDSIYLFSKHRDVAIIASLGYIPAIRHLL